MSSPLYVVAVISNPERYDSRYRLYRDFEARMLANPHVRLITLEHAFGIRPHAITDSANEHHLQLRGGDGQEVWLKEALINAGFRHLTKLDPAWQYAAWIDADVEFARPQWATEIIHELQHSKVIQPWSHAVDLGPNHETIGNYHSMLFCHRMDIPNVVKGEPAEYGQYWHSGYAWAIRRDAWDALGGLIDWCIMGSADHHMAWAFLGQINKTMPGNVSLSYSTLAQQFQERANRAINGQVGYVRGTILHHWHGRKRERFYQERWATLLENRFDPLLDLQYDHQGLPHLVGNKPKLRDGLRQYLRSRNEDSIDLE